MLYDCVQKQVQVHTDFVNTHLDMIHDVTGLGKLGGSQLEAVLALEEEIKRAATAVTKPLEAPGWQNYPMTPVASSFIKGAGAYKGKLLLEFHFDPGKIWGYDVRGQGTEFFEELMLSGSKGGWVWDKILGKPSQFGMAKGKFFAYKNAQGEQKFATTPGAEFVHHFGRPAEFTYNPVGYLNNSEEWYNVRAEQGKIWKESLVDPAQSRNPIEPSKLLAMQRNTAFVELQEKLKRRRALEELGPLIEKEQRREVLGEISELIKPHLTKKDFTDLLQFLLDSQITLTPVMFPVIDLVEDYKVKGYYANRGKPPVQTFVRRHTRGEGTTIKGKPRLTSKKVREAHRESIEGKGKLKVQGYYSMEMIIGKLSELEVYKEMYPDNLALQSRIDAIIDNFERLKKANTTGEVDKIESLIRYDLRQLTEVIEELETESKRAREGAKIIGEALSKIKDLKKYEDRWSVKQIFSNLGKLETSYALGHLSIQTFKVRVRLEVQSIDTYIQREELINRSKRTDWDTLDKEAERGIEKFDKGRLQERKNRLIYAKASIEQHKKRIKELKEQLKKVDPETGNYFEPFREGELGGEIIFGEHIEGTIKEIRKSLNQDKKVLEMTENLNKINPPGKFEFHDETFRLAGRSKFKESNLKWLEQVKKDYLKIPARFRDTSSSKIMFVDRTPGGFFGSKSNNAGGTYSPHSKRIDIATKKKIRDAFHGGSVIAHEMGHNVWYTKLTGEQRGKFTEVWRKHRDTMRKIGDNYASTSNVEGFAEAFMEYATGGIWYNRVWRNKGRIGEKLYPTGAKMKDLPSNADANKWGMLDDFPEMREFFTNNLGPNKNLEVNS